MRSQAIMCLSLITSMAALLLADQALGAELRTWTDASGTFTVQAELIKVDAGKVYLKRQDGREVPVELERLSAADQQFIADQAAQPAAKAAEEPEDPPSSGGSQELKHDDGKAAGKKSFPRGIASQFEMPGDGYQVTSVRIHGGRYGLPQPPQEDFQVALCDKDFNLIKEFPFPYSRFRRSAPAWVKLPIDPTEVPREFVICLNFNPTSTKGVYVSHDGEGQSLVGLPGKKAGSFTGGDWMIRVTVEPAKGSE